MNEIEDIQNDLYYLRLREGFSLMRYRNTTNLSNVLGDSSDDPKTFSYVKSRFTSIIYSLQDEILVEILLMAFNLSNDYEKDSTLTKRREYFSKKYRIKLDTLIQLENVAIRELIPKLRSVYYTGSTIPGYLPPIPIGAYLIKEITDRLYIDQIASASFSRNVTIIPLVNDVNVITIPMNYTKLNPISGISKVEKEESNGQINWKLTLDKILSIGVPYRLSFTLHSNSEQIEIEERNTLIRLLEGDSFSPRFLSLLTIPTKIYTIEIQFNQDYVPHWIWWFKLAPLSTYIPEWTKESSLELGQTNLVKKTFYDLPASGLICGVAWRWVKNQID
ncbi:hypothetical protein ACN9KL_07965 [Vagococcus fluvialis]|uniref:hypothetical protein n=1 Tax=Vagococcus fluvialis TaxID=2738 RepID=UPI003B223DF3